MKNTTHKALIAAAVASALLAGCSGGSGTGSGVGVVTGVDSGYFIDGPVVGLSYQSGGESGQTTDKGLFKYERSGSVNFKVGSKVNLGTARGKGVMSPLDMVPAGADARIWKAISSLLQSLDADGFHDNGIQLTPAMIKLLEQKLSGTIDFTTWDDAGFNLDAALLSLEQVLMAVDVAADSDGDDSTNPTYVSPDDAATELLANLAQVNELENNISKTPDQNTDKVGIDLLDVIVPAHTASGDLIPDMTVQPLITVYADGGLNGERVWDPYVAVSYDNGASWKRTNLFRKAGDSFTLNNVEFHAKSGGPSMAIAGRYILVSWTSTFCRGAPDYASNPDDTVSGGIDPTVPNPAAVALGDADTTDAYATDWFRVLGKQGTVTYVFENNTTLTNPYYCVWAARGVVAEDTGDITWRKPEQLTSGVRDAKLDWPSSEGGIGFGLVWQEDPEGLLPGEGEGPGVGWSGATTHHKTDIWYSFLKWADFEATDGVADMDPTTVADDDTITRPKVAQHFSVPVPVSNNNSCRLDSSGNLPAYCDEALVAQNLFCPTVAENVEIKLGTGNVEYADFCTTAEGFILDGDTGASRPNMHWAAKYDSSGNVIGARALITYEETKGLCEEGGGCPDAPYDTGKFVMYHHMADFAAPHMVKEGDILSHPVTYATTDPLVDWVLDDSAKMTADQYCEQSAFCEPGDPLYENSRRERFVINSDPNHPVKMVVIYKQGYYKQGERADIFARRLVGGWEIENFSPPMCASCVMPTDTGVEEIASGTNTTKVLEWDWQPAYVDHESWSNPFDDARSLRAKLDGDRLLIAYGWTPNWLLSTIIGGDGYFKDNYDFLVRRSFNVDSGYTISGDTVTFAADANQAIFFEPPFNSSNLANNKVNQVEPRLVTVPDSIVSCSPNWTVGEIQDPARCILGTEGSSKFIVTYCTAENTERDGPDGRPIHAPGLDCFFSWSVDNGQTYVADQEENADGELIYVFECLACKNDLEEVEPEVILTEDGMTMHTGWAQNKPIYDQVTGEKTGMEDSDAIYGRWTLVPEEDVTTTP